MEDATMSNENVGDLQRAIGHLRDMLAAERPGKTTTSNEYLVKLQAAIGATGRAIEHERWTREGSHEFQGE
jgi:hypothetical protein